MSTFFHLPAVGAEVWLLTHLVVREDAHVLYAFATEEERRLFRSLIKVSGVGPKIALALLSGISVSAFADCVAREEITTLARVPGVGKTAERLIVEMRPSPPRGTGGHAGAGRGDEPRERSLRGAGGARLPAGGGRALAQNGRSRYTLHRGIDPPCPAGRGPGVMVWL
jgi:Holliday junction resolvasome RuvABC DNA-binding subunit